MRALTKPILSFLSSAWTFGAAVVAIVVLAATFAYPNAWPITLTKEALDESGNPISGTLTVGDTINYVLSYSGAPNSPPLSNVTIDDVLSPNQTYVDGSIVAPPGWSWTTPPYASGNHTQYSHSGGAAPTSFAMNVAVSGVGEQSQGGDGTVPIPVGNRVYGIYHFRNYDQANVPGAQIYCWNLSDLSACGSSWPRSLDSGPDHPDLRSTTKNPRHHVWAGRIYYTSTSYDPVADETTPGIGCWDTATESACNFIPVSVTWPGQVGYSIGSMVVAGGNGVGNHVFVHAADQVFCIDVTTESMCWDSTIPEGLTLHWSRDLILELEANPTRLFVWAGGPNVQIRCLNVSDGSTCNGWTSSTAGQPGGGDRRALLSAVPNSAGNATAGVCLHDDGTGWGATDITCVSAVDGAPMVSPFAAPAVEYIGYQAFQIPGTARVLYPRAVLHNPECRDFSNNGNLCVVSDFSAEWDATPPAMQDYGYAVDPSAPDECLLGLGHDGTLWRFAYNGSMISGTCSPATRTETFELSDFFCSSSPNAASWDEIIIHDRPAELTGGTIVLKDANGVVLSTITVDATNTYPVNLSALGDNSSLTVEFTPTYTGDPDDSYELEITFTADKSPQICYQAVVGECGVVTNDAVLQAEVAGTVYTSTAATDLGETGGAACTVIHCLEVDADLTLGQDGQGLLTLLSSASGSINASAIMLSGLPAGVSVGQSAQPLPSGTGVSTTTWDLSGLAPGQNFTLQVDVIEPGGGEAPGADLCCSAEIEVNVPTGDVDLALEKSSSEPVGGSDLQTFTLTVSNEGDAFYPPTGGITITDTVPDGMTFTSVNGDNWDCGSESQFPLSEGKTLTCVYVGQSTIGDESLPVLNIEAQGTGSNCAVVSLEFADGSGDINPDNNEDCSGGLVKPKDPPPELETSCEVGLILVVDASGSINQAPGGAASFANRIRGALGFFSGGEGMSIFFNNTATVNQTWTTNLNSLMNNYTPSLATNWDAGLRTAYQAAVDRQTSNPGEPLAVVFITDGLPTAYVDPNVATPAYSSSDVIVTSDAVLATNEATYWVDQLYGIGVPVIGLGLGDVVSSGGQANLEALLNTTAVDLSTDTFDAETDRLAISENFNDVGSVLRQFVGDLCPDIRLSKNLPGYYNFATSAGSLISLVTLNLFNNSDTLLTGVEVQDDLPADLQFQSVGATSSGTLTHSGGVVTWSGIDIPPNSSENATFVVQYVGPAPAENTSRTVWNYAQVTALDDPSLITSTPGNMADPETGPVAELDEARDNFSLFNQGSSGGGTASPFVRVRKEKEGDPEFCSPAEPCTFNITVEINNTGTTDLSVLLGDSIPGAHFASISPALCGQMSGPSPIMCVQDFAPGSHTLNYTIEVDNLPDSGTVKNCFLARPWSNPIPTDFPTPSGLSGGQGSSWVINGAACYQFTVASPQLRVMPDHTPRPAVALTPVLEIDKSKLSTWQCHGPTLPDHPDPNVCVFEISVTNTGNATFDGPLQIDDAAGPPDATAFESPSPGASLVAGPSDENGWSCQDQGDGLIGCVNESLVLAPGETSRFSLTQRFDGPAPVPANCAAIAGSNRDTVDCAILEASSPRSSSVCSQAGGEWDGEACACPARHVFNPTWGRCTPLFCSPPMRLNEARSACLCPAGQELVEGRCTNTGVNIDRFIELFAPVISEGGGTSGEPSDGPPETDASCDPHGPVPC